MLEVKKFGKTKYGVWILGTLKYQGFEIKDIFKTNLKDIPNETNLKVKKLIVNKSKNGDIRFSLEF